MKDHSIIDQLRANGFEPFCDCEREECRISREITREYVADIQRRRLADYPDESPGTALAREVRAACKSDRHQAEQNKHLTAQNALQSSTLTSTP